MKTTGKEPKVRNSATFLRKRGWCFVMGQWRHNDFSYGWSTKDAVQLEQEADTGDARACRILGRATTWPT